MSLPQHVLRRAGVGDEKCFSHMKLRGGREYEKIRDVFDYTFVLIVKRIKSLENKIIQNGFCSIKEATDSITILKNDITDKMKKIEG